MGLKCEAAVGVVTKALLHPPLLVGGEVEFCSDAAAASQHANVRAAKPASVGEIAAQGEEDSGVWWFQQRQSQTLGGGWMERDERLHQPADRSHAIFGITSGGMLTEVR